MDRLQTRLNLPSLSAPSLTSADPMLSDLETLSSIPAESGKDMHDFIKNGASSTDRASSGGAIAIIVGAVGLVVIVPLLYCLLCCLRHRRAKRRQVNVQVNH